MCIYFLFLLTKLNSCKLCIYIKILDLCFTWTIYIEVSLTETILALKPCSGRTSSTGRTDFPIFCGLFFSYEISLTNLRVFPIRICTLYIWCYLDYVFFMGQRNYLGCIYTYHLYYWNIISIKILNLFFEDIYNGVSLINVSLLFKIKKQQIRPTI